MLLLNYLFVIRKPQDAQKSASLSKKAVIVMDQPYDMLTLVVIIAALLLCATVAYRHRKVILGTFFHVPGAMLLLTTAIFWWASSPNTDRLELGIAAAAVTSLLFFPLLFFKEKGA